VDGSIPPGAEKKAEHVNESRRKVWKPELPIEAGGYDDDANQDAETEMRACSAEEQSSDA
jgi:hypothetical protein